MATLQEALLIAFDLQREGRFAEADSVYGQILDAVPGHPPALHLRGLLLAQCGRLEEGCALVEQAIAGDGSQPDPHANHASLLEALGRFGEAADALARAAALDPDRVALLNNFAALQPESAPIRNNLSDAHTLCGDPEAALAEADAALARDPALADARLARASALLALGRFPQPLWSGQPLGGGRLLVWGEQGVGDELLFATLLPLLTQSSTNEAQSSTPTLAGCLAGCLLECDARLAPLFARALPGVEVVPRGPLPDPRLCASDIAAQIPSGSLPRLLLRAEEDFRRLRPVLAADPARTPAVRRMGRRPLVGIAWHTTNPKWGRLRNVPLADLARTLHAAGAEMVVLQYGDWAEEVAALADDGIAIALPPGLDRKDDLDGLAAQIAATDLVVTIDNATAHLAGALGHPVWVLLSRAPDWRWRLGRDDSPWYPTARLFRQAAAGDWRTPLGAVADRLGALPR